MTSKGFCHAVRFFKGFNKPWVALGGGGYHPVNVARAWTLAWSIMRDQELGQESLPAPFQATLRGLGYDEKWLRDEEHRRKKPSGSGPITRPRPRSGRSRKASFLFLIFIPIAGGFRFLHPWF